MMLDEARPRSITEILFDLSRDLFAFEEKFNLASDVFYARFMRGEMGDGMPFVKWAGRYELYLKTRHNIDSQLSRIAVPV